MQSSAAYASPSRASTVEDRDVAPWSFTASAEAAGSEDALIVCCLPLTALGIDDMVEEVTVRCGDEEGRRWCLARAEEYATSLVNALRLHLSGAELIIHVEDDDATAERLQIHVPPAGDPSMAALREAELADRVQAIRKRTWLTWWQGLNRTMADLRKLERLESAH
jgi:hypothetical protein